MLAELKELKNEIEDEIGENLTQEEIAYLEQIKSVSDLKNHHGLKDLAYDAAVAMGFSDDEAEKLIDEGKTSTAPEPEDYEALAKEYKGLIRTVNIFSEIIYETEYQMVDEVSVEGFASEETRKKLDFIRAQLREANQLLETFKCENSDFVARYKAARDAEKESQNKEMFEKFWNN